MSVRAEGSPAPAGGSATPAMRKRIAKLKRAGARLGPLMPAGSAPKKAEPGSEPTAGAPTNSSTPISVPSETPASSSKKPWQKPRNVREFAAQANEVATRVLNGEIDLETARNYASLARVVAQSASVEVTRARFLKKEPDLSLE